MRGLVALVAIVFRSGKWFYGVYMDLMTPQHIAKAHERKANRKAKALIKREKKQWQ